MPITLLDGILLVVILLSAALAMVRGFVREVLSILSWVAAFAAAYFFREDALPYVQDYISDTTIANVVAMAILFILALLIVSFITMRLSDVLLDSRIGALDRTLGFIFGAFRGYLLVAAGMVLFFFFVPAEKEPNWVANAKSRYILGSTRDAFVSILPDDLLSETFDKLKKARNKATTNTSNGAQNEEEAGYSPSERQGIEQLSETGGSGN
ncbi:CvpA family protein [Polycladidibacter stylochi]|uniref:CvpA family protein n=1 Tax=Polycladidibacter stylochi TaxID=1807766 RepID=UPI00082AF709|nr:CvpA family protein [Pseudovibrio stylochi]